MLTLHADTPKCMTGSDPKPKMLKILREKAVAKHLCITVYFQTKYVLAKSVMQFLLPNHQCVITNL